MQKKTEYISKDEFFNKKPKDNPSYYAIITSEVRYSKDISDSAKLLYGEITALSNKYGFAFPTNSYLANLYNVSERTIRRRLEELKKYNFVDVVLIRDSDTKEVLQRKIFPLVDIGYKNKKPPPDNNDHRSPDNNDRRSTDNNSHRSLDNNDLYSITRDNNINNNNKGVVVSKETIDKVKDITNNQLTKTNIEQVLSETNASEKQLLTVVELMTKSTTDIDNPTGWLIQGIKKGYEKSNALKFNNKKNEFHNFQQGSRNYTTNKEILEQLNQN